MDIKLLKDTEKKDHQLFDEIVSQIKDSTAVYGLIAFVTERGFFSSIIGNENSLSQWLLPLLQDKNSKLIFSLLNDEKNINKVIEFSQKNDLESLLFPKNRKIKIHDKVILFEKKSGLFSVIIGSHNWTSYALHKENSPYNSETSILLNDLHREDEIVDKLLTYIKKLKTLHFTEENKKVIVDQNKKRLNKILRYLSEKSTKSKENSVTEFPKGLLHIEIDHFPSVEANEIKLYLLISENVWKEMGKKDQEKFKKNGGTFIIDINSEKSNAEVFYTNNPDRSSFFTDLKDFQFYSVVDNLNQKSEIIEFRNPPGNRFDEIVEHQQWNNEGFQLGIILKRAFNLKHSTFSPEETPTIKFQYRNQ